MSLTIEGLAEKYVLAACKDIVWKDIPGLESVHGVFNRIVEFPTSFVLSNYVKRDGKNIARINNSGNVAPESKFDELNSV